MLSDFLHSFIFFNFSPFVQNSGSGSHLSTGYLLLGPKFLPSRPRIFGSGTQKCNNYCQGCTEKLKRGETERGEERKGTECSHILTKSACIVCIIFYIRLMDLWKHVKMLTSMSFEKNFM